MYSKDQVSKMSADQIAKIYGKKSVAIRSLDQMGFTRSEIAKLLDIRYQHVRNTLVQELKKPIVTSQESDSDDQMNLFTSK